MTYEQRHTKIMKLEAKYAGLDKARGDMVCKNWEGFDIAREIDCLKVWTSNKYISLYTGQCHYEYWIRWSGCDTAIKILHWVNHLCEKTWMTSDMVRRFIELAAEKIIYKQKGRIRQP